jgi:hypothetical protein
LAGLCGGFFVVAGYSEGNEALIWFFYPITVPLYASGFFKQPGVPLYATPITNTDLKNFRLIFVRFVTSW